MFGAEKKSVFSSERFRTHSRRATPACLSACVCILHVRVAYTLNRPFYPASSVHAVSVLIPCSREMLVMWSQTVRQRKT